MATALSSSSPPIAAAHARAFDGIVFRGSIYDSSGYADGNQWVLSVLESQRRRIQLMPVGLRSDQRGLLSAGRRRRFHAMQQQRLDIAQSLLYQCMPACDFELRLPARLRVGRTTFETDRIPHGWRERCNAMDQVWVPSHFNRRVFQEAGVEAQRLRVVPEGIDTSLYHAGVRPLAIPERRGFTFLSVFDWIDRKGFDVLLRAYTQAFHADDDVTLLLKTYKFDDPGADLEEALLFYLERTLRVRIEDVPPILFLQGLLPASAMPNLYASADAFVLPSRGEGWGRPYMEAAVTGLPVLATRWSGQLDFLHDGNSFLIDLEGVVDVPRHSDREVYIGHRWAEPSADHLSALMRQVVRDRAESRRRGQVARREMIDKWDLRVLAGQWQAAFEELLD